MNRCDFTHFLKQMFDANIQINVSIFIKFKFLSSIASQCQRWPTAIWAACSRPMKSNVSWELQSKTLNNYSLPTELNSNFIHNSNRHDRKRVPVKKNPLKNVRAMLKLNPYSVVAKRAALKANFKVNSNFSKWSFSTFKIISILNDDQKYHHLSNEKRWFFINS